MAELGVPTAGVALCAVGGYGRGELSPGSDLDVLLAIDPSYDEEHVDALAPRLWYPLWDDRVRLDHSVRTTEEVLKVGSADLRVAMGLLDLRHVAGDPALTFQLRANVMSAWRRQAKHRLPELAGETRDRWQRAGDLAHATTPDLKEGHGGLRDATLLRALTASWLIDVPATEVQRLRRDLLEIRDALHEETGRTTERLVAEVMPDVADRCGFDDADSLRDRVVSLGRSIAHLANVALRNIDWLEAPVRVGGPRRPVVDVVAPGVATHRGEVFLTEGARPDRDPLLALRAAHGAASRDLVLTDAAAARLGRESAPMPVPWPAEARRLFTSMLASGPALLDVFDALDEYGVVDAWLPEWKRVRYLAPQSPVHRFTVDRHLVQTCVEAAALGSVSRPDLLMVAALVHDIGKGDEGDHSEVGELIAWDIAGRLGFSADDAATIARLTRWHLLLVDVATRGDLSDAQTLEYVAQCVQTRTTLEILAVLTEADALATGPQAWSSWRSQLVDTLVGRVGPRLSG